MMTQHDLEDACLEISARVNLVVALDDKDILDGGISDAGEMGVGVWERKRTV
jgi:hypothetical protein